jgi:hypothetical protein
VTRAHMGSACMPFADCLQLTDVSAAHKLHLAATVSCILLFLCSCISCLLSHVSFSLSIHTLQTIAVQPVHYPIHTSQPVHTRALPLLH